MIPPMPGNPSDDSKLPDIVELVCKIPIKKGDLIAKRPHHDLLKLGSSVAIAPKFEELTQELG